jgi:helicase
MSDLLDKIIEIIEELEEFGFVEKKENYFYATKIGKRVSDLFLEPISAHELIQALKTRKTFTNFSYLYAWVNCFEFMPLLTMPASMRAVINEELSLRTEEIPFLEEKALFDSEAYPKFFSATVLEAWINEKKEDDLFKNFGVAPGSIFSKNQILEWLAYATIELSKAIGEERHALKVNKLALRVKYGVKEELLSLVELRGIGRVRARKLFSAGITKPSEAKTNFHKIEAILGKNVAMTLEKQLFFEKKEDNFAQKSL